MLQMAQPIIHHRHPEFTDLLRSMSENLRYLFQTVQPVMTLTTSGTGGMEAAVSNLLSRGDTAIYVNGGKFGERWGNILRAYGVKAEEMKIEWGTAVQREQIVEKLKQFPTAKAVYITHSETSTGVFTDVKAVAQAVHENSDAIVVVDGITAVGAHEVRMDDWGLDVVITGSQKGLMIPPGLAFIALSERAWKLAETSDLPKFYLSLKRARKSLEDYDTPWTPAITLIIGVELALRMIREEGIENIWVRHRKLSSAIRAGCTALGLKLFGNSPSYAVTAVWVPEGIEFKTFNKTIKQKYGITIAGGQDHLKGKIFRISHLGYYDELDMVAMISALEMTLQDCGWRFDTGAGVRAAQRAFSEVG